MKKYSILLLIAIVLVSMVSCLDFDSDMDKVKSQLNKLSDTVDKINENVTPETAPKEYGLKLTNVQIADKYTTPSDGTGTFETKGSKVEANKDGEYVFSKKALEYFNEKVTTGTNLPGSVADHGVCIIAVPELTLPEGENATEFRYSYSTGTDLVTMSSYTDLWGWNKIDTTKYKHDGMNCAGMELSDFGDGSFLKLKLEVIVDKGGYYSTEVVYRLLKDAN